MKKLLSSLPIIAMTGLAFFSSCKKAADVAPNVTKPVATVTWDGSTYGTENDFGVAAVVSSSGDSAFITLTVNNATTAQKINKIYMTYQQDADRSEEFKSFPNGKSIPAAGYNGTDLATSKVVNFNYVGGNILDGGTFNVPSGTTTFKLTIPVLLRNSTTAQSDIFRIWISGTGYGSFKTPSKNLAYGVATVTLNYTNATQLLYNYSSPVGDANDTTGSLFSTVSGSTYKRSVAAANVSVGKLIDFVYNKTGTNFIFGSFYNSANQQDPIVTAGFGDVSNITNYTVVVQTTLSATDFNNISNDAGLETAVNNAITAAGTNASNKVVYTTDPSNQVFAFYTKGGKGKKGLALIGTISSGIVNGSLATEAPLTVKVQQ